MTESRDHHPDLSVLGIIPARGGSKGVPHKNVAPLGGMPLIAHTIRAARASRLLDDVVLSTDSQEIAAVAREYGLQVPWLRPAELAGDRARVQDAVLHLLDRYPAVGKMDYLLLLQPTAPFRKAEDIDNAICLAASYDADSVVSFAREESHHPYYMYRYEAEHDDEPARVYPFAEYEPGLPRQEFPPCVYRNGAIYLVRRTYFLDHNSFISDACVPYLMPPDRSVNVDSPDDLAYAEFLLSRNRGSFL